MAEKTSRFNYFAGKVGNILEWGLNPQAALQKEILRQQLEGLTPAQREAYRQTHMPVLDWLNSSVDPATGKPLTAPAVSAEAVPQLDFGGTAPGSSAAPASPVPSGNPAEIFAKMFGLPTSTFRDQQKNASVGGVPNSYHTRGTPDNPFAVDIVPQQGETMAQLYARLKASGQYDEVINEGDHVHVAKNGGFAPMLDMAAPSLQPGNTTTAPGVSSVNPSFAMGMIPDPALLGPVTLPAAPHQAMPAPRPQLEVPDKEALLADIRKAIQPKPRDTKNDAWDRFAAALEGAAIGAQNAGRAPTTGQFLLAAGGGAAAGRRAETRRQEAEQKDYDEAVRQAEIALAKMGFDVDLSALAARNQNRNIDWQSGEDARQVSFANENADYTNALRQLETNLGIAQSNVGAINSTNRTRAQVGLSALQSRASAENTANAQQLQINFANEKKGEVAANNLLKDIGIDSAPTKDENQLFPNARQAARYIAANNVAGVEDALATEALNAGVDLPNDMFEKKELGELEKAIKKGDAPGAKAIILAAMRRPGNAMRVAQLLAENGAPTGTLVVKHNKAGAK